MEKKPIGFYNYTVVLTYIGMLSGFLGISCVMNGKLHTALICLMVAGICDMFDGAIASTMKRTADEKCFGIQIDSLSDLICFCVLPALIVYGISGRDNLAFMAAALYVLCGLIRLSFFNVDEMERQITEGGSRKFYFGMPVTLSALFLPVAMQLCINFKINAKYVGIVMLVLMAFAFLVPFKLKKPQLIGKICVCLAGVAELAFVILGGGDM